MGFRGTTAAAAAFVLCTLGAPAMASASTWQGPSLLSDPGVDTGRAAQISLGPAGDAAATWYEDTAGGRTMAVRKRAGQAWSTPVSLGQSTFNTKLTGVDSAGNVTAAGTFGNIATVSNWLAGAPAPTTTALTSPGDGDVLVRSMAVNATGVAVIGMTARGPSPATTFDVLVAYRTGIGGAFVLRRFTPAAGTVYSDPSVALNDAGSAIVSFVATSSSTSQTLAAVRTATTDFPASAQPVSTRTDVSTYSMAPVGMDSAGNALVAYTYNPSIGDYRLVVSRYRSLQQDWTESADLSAADAVGPVISVNAAGQAIVAWSTSHVSSAQNIAYARMGSSADPNAFGPVETVSGSFAGGVDVALGADGRAVVGWLITGPTGDTAQARVREANGAWGEVRDLSPALLSNDAPSVATDGHGHVAAVHTQLEGAAHRTMVSSLDSVAPTVAPIALSGSPLAGQPLTLAVAAGDVWSVISAAWIFGDGTTGSGTSVTHAYASAGSYNASVTVTDGAGNAVGRQLSISISAQQATLSTARFSAKWKQSRVKGTLIVTGSAPRSGTYVVDALKGTSRKIHASYQLKEGPFTQTIKLPAKLVPGKYRVSLLPSFPATQVKPAGRDAKLAAPAEGVVDLVVLSGAKNGPPARTLRNATTIWASFRFAAVPRGSLTLTWYRTVKGKKQNLGSTRKASAKKVASYLRLGGTLRGTFTAVLTRKGKVIARGSVKAL
jgi:hypothetical protein